MDVLRIEGDDALQELNNVQWIPGESRQVEYFSGKFVRVSVESSESIALPMLLTELADGHPISVDFEWKADRNGEVHPISTFQFASSKGVLVVLNDSGSPNPIKEFLTSHECFGKGMTCDNQKLQKMFGVVFGFEDIEVSKLIPHDLPVSFSQLVEDVVGKPLAGFKDKRISCSDWSLRPLSVLQVLYAAFDVYAMHLCYFELQRRFNEYEFIVTPLVARRSAKLNQHQKPKVEKKMTPISAKRTLYHMGSDVVPAFLDECDFVQYVKQDFEIEHFEPFESYTTKSCLYHRMKALNRIENDRRCVDCGLLFPNREELEAHLWSEHADEILKMFYLRQTPSFIAQLINQVVIAEMNIAKDKRDGPIKCKECGMTFNCFRALYTHCRIRHLDLSRITEEPNIKNVLYNVLVTLKDVENVTEDRDVGVCHLCGATFADNTAIVEHCWYEHADQVIDMWKSRPSCYPEELYKECENLGKVAIELLAGPQMIDGSLACRFCEVGLSDPGELFLHMFHKHCALRTVKAEAIQKYPMKVGDLPVMLQELIRRTTFVALQESLEREGIFDAFPSCVRCNECLNVFNDEDDEWDHLIHFHVVIGFDPTMKKVRATSESCNEK